jgi:hypothetical protein
MQIRAKTKPRRQPAYPFLLIHFVAFLLTFFAQTYPAPMSSLSDLSKAAFGSLSQQLA